MTTDIVLSGVGGQGILSIATVIGEAATLANINIKQAEVHGMSQRGGAVGSNLRLSDKEIWSDLIPMGKADFIISMEPMESLRYVSYLKKGGWIITSSDKVENISNYPGDEEIKTELEKYGNVLMLPIEKLAQDNNIPKCANMILLGMAAQYIKIVSKGELRESIERVFINKGREIVEMNKHAFNIGLNSKK